ERPGDYVDGAFRTAERADDEIVLRSPADQADVSAVHPVALPHVAQAVDAARRAFPAWWRLGEDARRAHLRAYQAELRAHEEDIALAIAREVGKPLWEARTEARALAGKVDLMLGEGAELTRDRAVEGAGEVRYRPHGVLAVLGPFNFPAHLPNGQIVPGLLHGNTVVFKPSDKAPSAATWMARCMDAAGVPPGVFNVVQGRVPTAQALARHDEVDGILFTGSAAVGKALLAENADRPGRMVALELGGKNASIVLDDADLERAARQIAFAAYATAGQRCTATSRVFATAGVLDALAARLAEAAGALRVGYPLDDGVFMGPLIDEGARSRLLAAQGRARAAGFDARVAGGAYDVPGRQGWYVRPAVHVAPSGDARVPGYSHDELFGPDVALYPVADLDEAITRTNGTAYGLAAAVFTASATAFEEASARLRVGILHHNRASAGASGRLPFGGVGDSGNHRPAGITAGTFCTWTQAVRPAPPADEALPSWPGLFEAS
ncbi:MAG: aldehyde dehydrogenase family protein, partial [Myxococcota bacterium]